MAIRYLKIILVVFVGLQGWLYVAGNLANWDGASGVVSYVLSQQEHQYYPTNIFPAFDSSMAAGIGLFIIVTGEFLVGALSMKGAWDLWKLRNGGADAFNGAKTYALLGPGMAMIVWFGGFIVIGGALFQMWQTQVGDGSFDGAFVYCITSGVVMLFVNQPDR